jgi:serine/threonine-protein kinase RsbW
MGWLLFKRRGITADRKWAGVNMESLKATYRADIANLENILDFTGKCAEQFGLAEKRKFGLLVAVEEAFVNVCHYAYPDGEGEVDLICEGDEHSFAVTLKDRGVAFNVLSLPDPDITSGVSERKIGGLGIYFIRKLTDDVSYRRENGQNILRMVLTTPKGS